MVGLAEGDGAPLDVLQVHDALEALATLAPRQGRIVELRFFVGPTVDETAAVLGVSPVTVSRVRLLRKQLRRHERHAAAARGPHAPAAKR